MSESADNQPSQNQPPLFQRLRADLILLSTALVWGANILVFKDAINGIDPWIFSGFRLVFAVVTLGALAWWEHSYRPPALRKRPIQVPKLICFCILSGLVYMLAFVQGIQLTTAGNTALLLASMPMWTAVLSFFFLAERLGLPTWGGLLITFVGTVLVTTQSGSVELAGEYLVGNLFVLFSAIAWAVGTVMSKSLLESISPLRLTFIAAVTTVPVHLMISLVLLSRSPEVAALLVQPKAIAAMAFSGMFSTGIAYAMWYAGVRVVGGSHAAVYQNVVTLVALVGGWLFLSEPVLPAQIIGGGLTVAGLLVMRHGRMKEERKAATESVRVSPLVCEANNDSSQMAIATPETPAKAAG